MNRLRTIFLSFILSVATMNHAIAEIKMCPLFTDNLVLQQASDAPVWGKAEPGAKVKVTTSWNKKSYTAGADHKFHWAEAQIVGNCVEVSCKDIPMPLAVRYAWAHNPIGNLYNGAGLPASLFRTDS